MGRLTNADVIWGFLNADSCRGGGKVKILADVIYVNDSISGGGGGGVKRYSRSLFL